MSIKQQLQGFNLNKFPELISEEKAKLNELLVIGDLHGNAKKLYHLLIHSRRWTLSNTHYEQFVGLYEKAFYKQDFNSDDLIQFKHILSQTSVEYPAPLMLIGDETGDRGANDGLILELLKKIILSKILIEILLSNHGLEFIRAYETLDFKGKLIGENQVQSLLGLKEWIDKGIITQEEVLELVNTAYKPCLKVLSYTLSAEGITLYSHAPIDIRIIPALSKKLGVAYNDDTAEELANTIDNINAAFTRDYVNQNKVHTLFDSQYIKTNFANMNPETNPFEYIVWNKNYWFLEREPKHKGYQVNYVHGHDKNDPSFGSHLFSIDDTLGSSQETNVGSASLLWTQEKMSSRNEHTSSNSNSYPSLERTVTLPLEEYLTDLRSIPSKSNTEESLIFSKNIQDVKKTKSTLPAFHMNLRSSKNPKPSHPMQLRPRENGRVKMNKI